MKALWIVYDIVLDETILKILEEFRIVGFTRWPRLSGRGPKSGARLDDHVWPGANAAIMTAQDEAVIAGVMVRLQSLRDEAGAQTGIWAFTMPVLDMLA